MENSNTGNPAAPSPNRHPAAPKRKTGAGERRLRLDLFSAIVLIALLVALLGQLTLLAAMG